MRDSYKESRQITLLLKKIFEYYFYTFIIVFVFLPLGSFSLLKTFMFLILVILFFFSIEELSVRGIAISFLFLLLLLIPIWNSILRGFYGREIFIETKSLIGFFLIVSIGIISLKKNIVKPYYILLAALVSHIAYVILKLIVIILILMRKINSYDIMLLINSISSDFVFAYFGQFPRISISNDFISPILLTVLLFHKKLLNKYFYLLSFLLIVNIIFSLNRYALFMLIIVISFILLFNMKRERKYVFKVIVTFLLFSILLLGVVHLYKPFILSDILNTWSNRFGGEGVASLDEKLYQYRLFYANLNGAIPIIGAGMGEYLKDYIRSHKIRYGYEAFAGVFFFQMGAVIFSLYTLLYFYYFFSILKALKFKKVFIHLVLGILWFFSGFFNPLILNSTSAIIYLIIIASCELARRGLYENRDFRNSRNS